MNVLEDSVVQSLRFALTTRVDSVATVLGVSTLMAQMVAHVSIKHYICVKFIR